MLVVVRLGTQFADLADQPAERRRRHARCPDNFGALSGVEGSMSVEDHAVLVDEQRRRHGGRVAPDPHVPSTRPGLNVALSLRPHLQIRALRVDRRSDPSPSPSST